MFKTWSGLSSNDGRVSNPKPARSDGLDDVAIGAILTVPIVMRVLAASWVTGLGDHKIAPVAEMPLPPAAPPK
jgi:hypothetical protein